MHAQHLAGRVGLYALAGVIFVWAVFPFCYAVVASLSTDTALLQPLYAPFRPNLSNYRTVLFARAFPQSVLNSVFIASVTVLVSLSLAVTAAYALSRVQFRGRKLLLMAVLSITAFPQVSVLAGFFELVRRLGLFNTPWALILSYSVFTLPFTVWFLTAIMRDLPRELEEAAIIDGATPWDIVLRVFLPLLWPAILTTGIMAFIAAWNEFLFALVLTASETMRTAPIAIMMSTAVSPHEVPWGTIMAGSVTVTLPVVALALIFQNRIIEGLKQGGING